jgi:phosphohistidine phosphatase SixA
LRNAGVTAIITSSFTRTVETAKPLAAALRIEPKVVPIGRSVKDHIAAVAAAVRGETGAVVVVGHSNTVPEAVTALGGPKLLNLCESVYDELFVVSLAEAKASVVRVRYGAANAVPDANCRR